MATLWLDGDMLGREAGPVLGLGEPTPRFRGKPSRARNKISDGECGQAADDVSKSLKNVSTLYDSGRWPSMDWLGVHL
jgi:hypothetical protein